MGPCGGGGVTCAGRDGAGSTGSRVLPVMTNPTANAGKIMQIDNRRFAYIVVQQVGRCDRCLKITPDRPLAAGYMMERRVPQSSAQCDRLADFLTRRLAASTGRRAVFEVRRGALLA